MTADVLNQPEHLSAWYRAVRSSALWFARGRPSSAVIRGREYTITRQELIACSENFYRQSVELWDTIRAGVRDAAASQFGMNDASATSASIAVSHTDIDAGCICPRCTRRELDRAQRGESPIEQED